ncbi:hypothetical protein LZ554_000172 [Drepanopeziza brunnea f. sp. 'monogermtubi']|nr:hypothetical protein LZ554_000172 [Drepanopeziza brunnea f. sp. 'monogermtubi']
MERLYAVALRTQPSHCIQSVEVWTARKFGEAILGWLERHIPDIESEAESRSKGSDGAYKYIAPGTTSKGSSWPRKVKKESFSFMLSLESETRLQQSPSPCNLWSTMEA